LRLFEVRGYVSSVVLEGPRAILQVQGADPAEGPCTFSFPREDISDLIDHIGRRVAVRVEGEDA